MKVIDAGISDGSMPTPADSWPVKEGDSDLVVLVEVDCFLFSQP